MAELCQALKTPKYLLYLGRKACPPALGLEPQVLDAPTLKQAFEIAAFADLSVLVSEKEAQRQGGRRGSVPVFWDHDLGIESGLRVTQRHVRRDQPHSRQRWQFTAREECEGVLASGEASC